MNKPHMTTRSPAFDPVPTKTQSQVIHSATSLYSFSPSQVVHPGSESEIVEIVKRAAKTQQRVRAIGAVHSQAPIPATEGVCLVFDRYNQLIEIKGNLVTVEAGMRLWELNETLAQHSLALPTGGAIAEQTVSGAIATGTHGGSLYQQSLSSYVECLRIVCADGSVKEISCHDPTFAAVGLSMGMLGIVSTVTFRCVGAFSLQSEVIVLSTEDFLQQFDQLNRNHKYIDIKYAPIIDQVQVLTINPTEEPIKTNSGWHPPKKTKTKRQFDNFLTASALRLFDTHKFNWLQRSLVQQYEKTAYVTTSGRSDFVLTHFEAANDRLDQLIPVADMEVAVPYSQAVRAIAKVQNYFDQTQQFPNMSIHIRCSAADNFWLSPAYQQTVCWLEFYEYPRTGKFFGKIVELLQSFDCRYHWGKKVPANSQYLQQQYEKWSDFIRLRQQWDSSNMFINRCLEPYFYV